MNTAYADWDADRAKRYAVKWIIGRLGDPGYGCQFHDLMGELALLAIDDTFKAGGDETILSTKLDQAHEILARLQGLTSHKFADQQADDRGRALTIWRRRDVVAVFQGGYENHDFFAFERDGLERVAADYLTAKWMRHPIIDWIIVDALVTGETIVFGEELKQGRALEDFDKRIDRGKQYRAAKGNWRKMNEPPPLWKELTLMTMFHPLLPIFLIYLFFNFDFSNRTAQLIAGMYLCCYVAVYYVRRIIARRSAPKNAKSKEGEWHDRWLALREIWSLLPRRSSIRPISREPSMRRQKRVWLSVKRPMRSSTTGWHPIQRSGLCRRIDRP